LAESPEFLNRKRLTSLLEQFGEYPAKYRLLIWGFLMEVPHNQMAFQVRPTPLLEQVKERRLLIRGFLMEAH
jgi:hypothetical protein